MTPDVRRSTASQRWLVRRLRRLPGRVWAWWRWVYSLPLRRTYRLIDVRTDTAKWMSYSHLRVWVAVMRGGVEVRRFEVCGYLTSLEYADTGRFVLGEEDAVLRGLVRVWQREHPAPRRGIDFTPLNEAIAQLKPVVKQAQRTVAENEAGMREVLAALKGQA